MVLLQNPKGLSCDSLIEPAKRSIQCLPATGNASPIGAAGSTGQSVTAACKQHGPVAEPSFVLGSIQNQQLFSVM